MANPWRDVVSCKTETKEHFGKGRGFSWWVSYTQKVKLSCGHVKVYHGHNRPKTKARCKECGKIAAQREEVAAPS